jgi:DNA-binding CsgD family transcriptional regulator/tetratricopeptide (TPR) repeat protein
MTQPLMIGYVRGGDGLANLSEVFVGRHREIEAMCAALDAASAGRGGLTLVAGDPGIGKTRTALELTAHAAKRSARVLWGRCHEEEGAPPYWPWVQILRAAVGALASEELQADLEAGAGDIAEILPEIRPRLADLGAPAILPDPTTTRFRLFGSITRFLINLSRRETLVLVLDDLHWADVPSLKLLEFLAQELADSRVLLVGAYRETELSRRHRLSDTLGALARAPHILRLHLAGLNAEDVRRFVVTAAGMTPPLWLTSAIHTQTEGNPLFVREVVRLLEQGGHFASASLQANAAPSIRLPEGVREVIGRRLNLLPSACNEILTAAAVIGREFGLDVLAQACRPEFEEEAVLEALDRAMVAHIVEETAPGRCQFTHNLVRITLYDELRTGQRRRMHHLVGEAIELVHRRDLKPVLADLAHHFRASGLGVDVERAIDYAIHAGRRADAALAFEDAINLFQNALDMIDATGDSDQERRCDILLLLGNAQRAASDYPQALESLKAAAAIARSQRLSNALVEIAILYEDVAWRHTAHVDARPEILLEEALKSLPDDSLASRVRLMGSLANSLLHTGRTAESKALSLQAIAIARRMGDAAALARSLAALADFPWLPHENKEMLAHADELAAMGDSADDPELGIRGHFRRMSLLLELGDMKGAVDEIETMGRLNARIRQPFYALWELGSRATIALLRGTLEEAERLIVQSARSQESRRSGVVDPLSLLIFTLHREQGKLRGLGPLVATFVKQNSPAATWRPALALLYVELGDLDAARAVFNDLADEDFAAVPRDGRWATCLSWLAEVCLALRDAGRARTLYRLLSPWEGRCIVMGGGTGCRGSSGRFLGMLAALEENWPAAERHFAESISMNEQMGALVPAAHTQCDLAEMRLRRGGPVDGDGVRALLDQVDARASTLGLKALADRVSAARERLLASALALPEGLTPREVEVLRLMAIGRGNADISTVLAISRSTVATHVHNILTKTGCANRTEAAAFAVRTGLVAGAARQA